MADVSEKKPWPFKVICRAVAAFSPKYRLYGTDRLPPEACVLVGNHCQMYGPVAAELYMPRPHETWCVGEMTRREEVPAYAFREFWSGKPKSARWFYRLLSHLIAPLSAYIFTNAHTIPVDHDARVITTFRKSMDCLKKGEDIVIFPESHQPCNGILWQFQDGFIDLALLYHKRTGQALCFVPMYISPSLAGIHFGSPIRYHPERPPQEERTRICQELMTAITDMARELPRHVVVPFPNWPKSQYPYNQ